MPQTRKIATCCYCGARSMLVLDKSRHELSCSACGAPLHDMKFMPIKPRPSAASDRKVSEYRPKSTKKPKEERRAYKPAKKRRKNKPLSRKIFEELWDVVEEIFD